MDPPEVLERVRGGLALVDRTVRNFLRSRECSMDIEDLIAYGRIGLLAAARAFDPNRGPSFEAYASIRIRGAIWDATAADVAMRLRSRAVARAVTGREDEASALIGLDPEQAVSDAQRVASLVRWLRELPPEQAELIRRHHFEGEDLDRIGRDLGVSRSWASRLHRRAIQRLSKQARKGEPSLSVADAGTRR
jgi:RNA polymerase sigma factor FliA